MSIDAILWALKQDVLGIPQSVLIRLADLADNDSYVCYPTINHLIDKTGWSERAIRNAIKHLIKCKMIAKKVGAGRQSSQYKMGVNGARSLLSWLDCNLSCAAPGAGHGTNSVRSAAPGAAQEKVGESVVRHLVPVCAAPGAALYNQSLNQSLKKQSKKELDENPAAEKASSQKIARQGCGSEIAHAAVDNARKILAGSSSAELKTPLSVALSDSGLDLKNIVDCNEIENESLVEVVDNETDEMGNESLKENAVVESLEPWES